MRQLVVASGAALALALSGALHARDKKADKAGLQVSVKVIAEDAKVRVTEATWAPGAVNPSPASSQVRVVRAIKGGTLERTYADGKKERVEWKEGQVRINQPGPAFTNRNVGTTPIVLYIVALK